MTLKEMDEICQKHKGICKHCPLNCVDDWYETNKVWCFKSIRYEYNKKWQRANIEQKEEIMKEYAMLEMKYLKKEGNK